MAILHGPCHHVISSLFFIMPLMYFRLPPLSLTEHVQCPACSLTFCSGLSQTPCLIIGFIQQIYFFCSFNRKNTSVLTKLAQSTRHLVSALPLAAFDSTTSLGSLRPAAPICCRHPARRGLPFCFSVSFSVFCHVTFLFFSSVSGNELLIMHAHPTASFW